MWVIVITLALPFGDSDVSQVPGFRTAAQCFAAGEAWLESLPAPYLLMSSFECRRTA